MIQLAFPFTHKPTPKPPATLWACMGAWMMGDAPEPVELSAILVADRHRREVRALMGRRG